MTLEVRPFDFVGERFIGHADQAVVAIVARNILHGRGPTNDSLHILHGGGAENPDITHTEGQWSIYISTFVAMFFAVFGASRLSLLLAASSVKVLLAWAVFGWVAKTRGAPALGFWCALAILCESQIIQAVSGLADIYLALAVFLSVITVIQAALSRSPKLWLLAGLFIGLAIAVTPRGLVLIGFLPCFFLLLRERLAVLKSSLLLPVGTALSLLPFWIINYRASGSIRWLDWEATRSECLLWYSTRPFGGLLLWSDPRVSDAWFTAAYDPTVPLHVVPGYTMRILSSNFVSYIKGLATGAVLPSWLMPLAVLTLVAWFLRRRSQGWQCAEATELFTGTSFILLLGTVGLGSFGHPEPRYFLFLIPLFLVSSMFEASKWSGWAPTAIALTVVASGLVQQTQFQYFQALNTRNVDEYRTVRETLPEDAVVMTQNPWEFTFHTGLKSVIVPYTSSPEVLLKTAERYKVTHLVVIKGDIRHPELRELNFAPWPVYIETVYQDQTVRVGRIRYDLFKT